jgi:ATP-dependent helicase/nuclease subunit A
VPRNDARILSLPAEGEGGDESSVPVWSRSKGSDPAPVTAARAREEERIRQEYHRLLYVGMTRAKDRLVIAGFETTKGRGADCWYDMVHDRLVPLSTRAPAEDGSGEVLRFQTRPFAAATERAAELAAKPVERPAWLDAAAAPERAPTGTLSPSKALAAADANPRAADTPFLRDARAAGILVHRLLELLPGLPAGRREDAARSLAASRGASVAPERRDAIVAQVLALLEDPRLEALFGPGSRAEASLAGRLPAGADGATRAVAGQVDRLAITATEVLVADYKTTARPPASPGEIPEVYVGQLAVYRALMAQVAPGRPVRSLLIYTSGPVVIEVPGAMLDAALARITAA